jgi:hypothetical protein
VFVRTGDLAALPSLGCNALTPSRPIIFLVVFIKLILFLVPARKTLVEYPMSLILLTVPWVHTVQTTVPFSSVVSNYIVRAAPMAVIFVTAFPRAKFPTVEATYVAIDFLAALSTLYANTFVVVVAVAIRQR